MHVYVYTEIMGLIILTFQVVHSNKHTQVMALKQFLEL